MTTKRLLSLRGGERGRIKWYLNQGGRPYVVCLFMGGGQRKKPFIKPFGTGDEESFKDLFKNHFVEGGYHAQ